MQMLAESEGLSRPLSFLLRRAAYMKDDQVVSEVFCWVGAAATVVARAASPGIVFYGLVCVTLCGARVPDRQGIQALFASCARKRQRS